jgi:hypothetical protein
MKPEQQRIAIAEACGWRRRGRDIWDNAPFPPQKLLEPPDYLHDLNAMHEAEKVLFPKHEAKWAMIISEVCGHSWRIIYTATATQRAEAFLKTIGKWTTNL